jgi:hypothetical protein
MHEVVVQIDTEVDITYPRKPRNGLTFVRSSAKS